VTLQIALHVPGLRVGDRRSDQKVAPTVYPCMPMLRRSLVALALLAAPTAFAAPGVDRRPPGGVLDPTPGPSPGPVAPAIDPVPDKLDPGFTSGAACPRPDACVQTDDDGDGVPDMWEDKLAVKFAPELHLPPQSEDWTRPANVDWYLARVHMRFEHDDCSDCQVLGVGAVTQESMWQQSHRGKNWRCAHKGSWHASTEPTNFFLQPPNDSTHNGAPPSEWRVYDHVRRIATGYDIQFWVFFAYNDSVGSANHEADWEHITVRTDDDGNFVSAWYAQHEGGQRYTATALTFAGTHPRVWVADGSHASYPSVGAFDIPNVPAFDDHTYDGGPVWQTWTNLIHVGEKSNPRGGQHFIRYGGRWGEHGSTPWTTGPRGPSFQGAWDGV